MLRHLIPACLFALAFVTCVRVGKPMGRAERSAWKLVTAPPLATMSTSRINLLMLGHRGLYDDFATVWAVQFLAENSLSQKASADEVYEAIRAITRHQPKLEALYLVSCYVLALDFDRADYCEQISIDGLKAFPDSWRIPMTQGFIAVFKLKDSLKAASFLELAASRPNSPAYVARLAKKMAEQGYASGSDLNETLDMLREVPGGTRIIELLRQRVVHQPQSPQPSPQSLLPPVSTSVSPAAPPSPETTPKETQDKSRTGGSP